MPVGIDDLRRDRAAAATAMETAAQAVADLESADAPDQTAIDAAVVAFDATRVAFDRLVGQVTRAELVEQARAASARAVGGDLPRGTGAGGAVPAAVVEPGLRFGAMVRTFAAAGGDLTRAQALAEAQGNSGLFAALNTGSAAAGGVFIPEDVSGDVIEFLRPASVVAAMGPQIIPMANGNMTFNRQTAGSTFGYGIEGADAPVTEPAFGQLRLSAKKMSGVVPLSNDLLREGGTGLDRMVRDDMQRGVGQTFDRNALRGGGGDAGLLGLRFQALPGHILAANGAVNLVNVTTDLGRLELALMNAEIDPGTAHYVLSPRTAMFLQNVRDGNGNFAFPEILDGKLRRSMVHVTTQLPSNLGAGTESEILLVAPSQVLIGDTLGLQISVSSEAAYKDAGGNLVSAFSRDETAMRVIVKNDIGLRQQAAAAVLTGVTWGV